MSGKAKAVVKLNESTPTGVNIEILSLDGAEEIVIRVPLNADAPLSKSEKSRVLASTGGFYFTADGTGVSLNVTESVRRPRTS